jgi:two-component system chemotaxis response regulator CheY
MPVADHDLSNLKLLIVDDKSHMAILLREVVRALGIRNIRTAAGGADALETLRGFDADVILGDWNMRPVDGLQFVRSIRTGADSPNPTVPIIMLTGHSDSTHVAEARDSGVTEFLAKPVSAAVLHERIAQAVGRRRAAEGGGGSGP